jgi:cyclopropane fatty-acyl-phospholipid synthase-like methyltransferase
VGNEKIRPYYERMAANIKDPLETRNKAPDFSRFDIAYMETFLNKDHALLDLGAGSGLLLNHIAHGFRKVVAVELYEKFSQFIKPAPHITVINQDILGFDTAETFDTIILFGVMNFFSNTEAESIYRKLWRFAKPGGSIVVKNQMGVGEDVLVDRFSEELQQSYYSEYRCPESESRLMQAAGFDVRRVDDIYPDEFNRWPNTRFKVIVAGKPA